MAEIYVDAAAAAGGTGTIFQPFNTLAATKTFLDGSSKTDIDIYLKGTFREAGVTWTALLTRCRFLPWPGERPAEIRGDQIMSGTWVNGAGNRWTIALAAAPTSVVEDWDIRIDSFGRNFGHLTALGSSAAVEGTAGSWFWSGGTLHVHASDSSNPNVSGRVYGACRFGNANVFSGNTDCRYEFDTALFCDPTNGSGYSVFDGGSTRCIVKGMFRDAGFHTIGFVGTACVDHFMDSCTFKGMRSSVASNLAVFFASAGNVTGLAFNCHAHMYGLLRWDGAELNTGNPLVGGYFFHATAPAVVTQLDFVNCWAYGYSGCGGDAIAGGTVTAAPGNRDDAMTFPVRVIGFRALNCASSQSGLDINVGYIRCHFDLTRFANDLPTSLAGFGPLSGASAGCGVTCESCAFIINMDDISGEGTPDGRRLVNWSTAADLRFFGCLMRNTGVTAIGTAHEPFFYPSSVTPTLIKCRQCVFSHAAPHNLHYNDVAIGGVEALWDFADCWYDGIDNNNYAQSAARNTEAEWIAGEDALGVYDVAATFWNPPMSMEPPHGSALRTTTKVVPGVTRKGLNGRAYSGHYGPFQYGGNLEPVRYR